MNRLALVLTLFLASCFARPGVPPHPCMSPHACQAQSVRDLSCQLVPDYAGNGVCVCFDRG